MAMIVAIMRMNGRNVMRKSLKLQNLAWKKLRVSKLFLSQLVFPSYFMWFKA